METNWPRLKYPPHAKSAGSQPSRAGILSAFCIPSLLSEQSQFHPLSRFAFLHCVVVISTSFERSAPPAVNCVVLSSVFALLHFESALRRHSNFDRPFRIRFYAFLFLWDCHLRVKGYGVQIWDFVLKEPTHGNQGSAIVASAYLLLALPVAAAVVNLVFVTRGFELTSLLAFLDFESEGDVASAAASFEIVQFRWRW